MQQLQGTDNAIKVGDYVEVLYEYAPGTCSDGGVGTVSAIFKDGKGTTWCTVGYILDSRIETGIHHEGRITVTMMPFKMWLPIQMCYFQIARLFNQIDLP
jgi:hypothetical protein